jgi:hypothetical protein
MTVTLPWHVVRVVLQSFGVVAKTVRRRHVEVPPLSDSWLRQLELYRGKHPEGS